MSLFDRYDFNLTYLNELSIDGKKKTDSNGDEVDDNGNRVDDTESRDYTQDDPEVNPQDTDTQTDDTDTDAEGDDQPPTDYTQDDTATDDTDDTTGTDTQDNADPIDTNNIQDTENNTDDQPPTDYTQDDTATDTADTTGTDTQTDNTATDTEGDDQPPTDYTQDDTATDDQGTDDTTGTDTQTDDTVTDDNQQQMSNSELLNKIKDLETQLFANLTPEQINIKNIELKTKFIEMHELVQKVITRIDNLKKTEENIHTLDFVIKKLSEMLNLLNDYITKTYDTNTYFENLVNYKTFLATLEIVTKIMNQVKGITKSDLEKLGLDKKDK